MLSSEKNGNESGLHRIKSENPFYFQKETPKESTALLYVVILSDCIHALAQTMLAHDHEVSRCIVPNGR